MIKRKIDIQLRLVFLLQRIPRSFPQRKNKIKKILNKIFFLDSDEKVFVDKIYEAIKDDNFENIHLNVTDTKVKEISAESNQGVLCLFRAHEVFAL